MKENMTIDDRAKKAMREMRQVTHYLALWDLARQMFPESFGDLTDAE